MKKYRQSFKVYYDFILSIWGFIYLFNETGVNVAHILVHVCRGHRLSLSFFFGSF